MEFIETDINKYNDFAVTLPRAEFLQSRVWPEIIGGGALHFFVMESDRILAAVRIISRRALGINFWTSPRAPIFASDLDTEKLAATMIFLKSEIQKSATGQSVAFWRIEPVISKSLWESMPQIPDMAESLAIQPKQTLVIDLTNNVEKLIASMHQKTRYNIRLAEKKGLKVREAESNEHDKFSSLMSETGNRDGFRIHSSEHYANMISRGSEIFKLYLVEKDDQVLAAGIFAFFGDTVTYVHGASSNINRQLMAPYLLHWFLIQEAKKQGYLNYDFYGVDNSKWPGVTPFKMGFGGHIEAYPGTFDIIFHTGYYNLYRLFRVIRRILPL